MSKSRQSEEADERRIAVRTFASRLPDRMRIDGHSHSWPQLIFAARGALAVEAGKKRWIVPPHRGLWAPAGVEHAVEAVGEAWMRTLYIHPLWAAEIANETRVLDVSPFLRELILEAVRLGILDEDVAERRALATLLATRIAAAPRMALDLPLPVDPRARRVSDRTLASLHENAGLAALARGVGASPRTLERIFLAETGLSFGRWRQQARLQRAVRLICEGASVAKVAFACGYESVSAFVAMFKLATGVTPGRYLADP